MVPYSGNGFFLGASVPDFTLNDGNIIDSTVTFDNPVGLSDPIEGQNETFAIIWGPAVGFDAGTYTVTRIQQVTSIGGASGDYTGVLPSHASTFTAPNVSLAQVVFGNLTNSTMTFTSFNIVTAYVGIVPLGAPINNAFLLICDQVTPAPGAMLLLGFGVLGLVAAHRRTAKALNLQPHSSSVIVRLVSCRW